MMRIAERGADMSDIRAWTSAHKYATENPFWFWDFISDQYALDDFVFEMVQVLSPETEEDERIIEDEAANYVRQFVAIWESMNGHEQYRFAESLERMGADVDYNLIDLEKKGETK